MTYLFTLKASSIVPHSASCRIFHIFVLVGFFLGRGVRKWTGIMGVSDGIPECQHGHA